MRTKIFGHPCFPDVRGRSIAVYAEAQVDLDLGCSMNAPGKDRTRIPRYCRCYRVRRTERSAV